MTPVYDGLTEDMSVTADVPADVQRMKHLAVRAHRLLGCRARRVPIFAGTTSMGLRAFPARGQYAAGDDTARRRAEEQARAISRTMPVVYDVGSIGDSGA